MAALAGFRSFSTSGLITPVADVEVDGCREMLYCNNDAETPSSSRPRTGSIAHMTMSELANSVPIADPLNAADRIGVFGAMLCAAHCAALPIVIAAVPALGLSWWAGSDFDQAFALFASVLGFATMHLGLRRHGRFQALLLFLPALMLLWVGSFTPIHDHGLRHALLLCTGGVLLAAAHTVNLRLHGVAIPAKTSIP